MKAGQFTNEQIVAILQEVDKGEKTVAQLAQEKGVSDATIYAWRKKFGGLATRDVTRLRELDPLIPPQSSEWLVSVAASSTGFIAAGDTGGQVHVWSIEPPHTHP